MGIAVDELISELRIHGGNLDDSELSDDDALLLLNRAYWELLANYGFRETEKTVQFDTISGGRKYELPTSSHAVNIVSVLNPDSSLHIQLIRSTKQWYENNYVATLDAQAIPTNYIRDGKCIYLWPTPDVAYTIFIRYWQDLVDLESSDTTTPDMPRNWHEIVLYGALYRYFLRQLDFDKANTAKAFHANLINTSIPVESKEEFDNRQSGIEYLGRGDNYV